MTEEKKPRSLGKILLIIFLSILGAIIGLAIILAAWLWVKNPLNIRAMILEYFGVKQVEMQVKTLPSSSGTATSGIDSASDININSIPITDAQREAAEKAGIDVNAIQITPEMETCFKNTLGEPRVQEIINGALPGPLDIFKARSCL